jgi:hypothetical protein
MASGPAAATVAAACESIHMPAQASAMPAPSATTATADARICGADAADAAPAAFSPAAVAASEAPAAAPLPTIVVIDWPTLFRPRAKADTVEPTLTAVEMDLNAIPAAMAGGATALSTPMAVETPALMSSMWATTSCAAPSIHPVTLVVSCSMSPLDASESKMVWPAFSTDASTCCIAALTVSDELAAATAKSVKPMLTSAWLNSSDVTCPFSRALLKSPWYAPILCSSSLIAFEAPGMSCANTFQSA